MEYRGEVFKSENGEFCIHPGGKLATREEIDHYLSMLSPQFRELILGSEYNYLEIDDPKFGKTRIKYAPMVYSRDPPWNPWDD
jgi:hypothetical protein